MLRSIPMVLLSLAVLAGLPHEVQANEGQTAPDFALNDVDGRAHRLSQYRGKWVVLEWVNFECASVQRRYAAPARTVPALQSTWRAKGVVWLSIHSNVVGQKTQATAAQCKANLARYGGGPTALLFDPGAAVATQYKANVAPEVRVISPKGLVVYAGGIAHTGTDAPARYLDAVLAAGTGGRAIPYAAKPAQGCRLAAGSAPAAAPAATFKGPKAPDFLLVDSNGFTHQLKDYRGKWVILEWVNYDCPYVKKHYHSSRRSMQLLQQRAKRYGMVWLSICSSARGKEGSLSSAQANARIRSMGATPAAYLHDTNGAVGRAYRAMTTPDMRIISPQGTIEYSGSIDSVRSMRASDLQRADNYVRLAIADIVAGRAIRKKATQPYGCSVKY